jgi:3D (Asp-Asp-Asp) domain-containing protein
MTNLVITAYCACTVCCGPNAANLTASGRAPVEGRTIAATRALPLGTQVALTVPGAFTNRVFIVEDRLARRYDSRVDIFIADHQRAKQWGKQTGTLIVIKQPKQK